MHISHSEKDLNVFIEQPPKNYNVVMSATMSY